ncbi:MAG TPA: hypothetical protein VNN09_03525 [Candidatus Competibacteraceae bacterium]|nr:hypothetical protein [Candidatus Competibacteraceae bacterium]
MSDKFTDDEDILDDVDSEAENLGNIIPKASKAWRSIERYREMKELRKNLDDFFYDDSDDPLDDVKL